MNKFKDVWGITYFSPNVGHGTLRVMANDLGEANTKAFDYIKSEPKLSKGKFEIISIEKKSRQVLI